jgi:hypothetical protein
MTAQDGNAQTKNTLNSDMAIERTRATNRNTGGLVRRVPWKISPKRSPSRITVGDMGPTHTAVLR